MENFVIKSKSGIIIDQSKSLEILLALRNSENILIISHRGPDADSIGSNLALRHTLEKWGKKVSSACIDPLPANCRFLKKSELYISEFALKNFDTIISVDCGSKSQVGFGSIYENIFNSEKTFINIDHHISNDHFGTVNLVELKVSSTCEIIYQLLESWQEKITAEIATCLLIGLYYDTGSFMHSNTSPSTLEVAEKLLANGANLNLIIEKLYHNFNEAKFHLWGNILSSMKVTNQKSACAVVTMKDFANTQSNYEDLSGLIDYLSMTKDSSFGILLSEDDKGNIKGSLRTRSDHINLSELAQKFGGGGHSKASGFSMKGKIKKEDYWRIEPTISMN